MDYFLIAVYGLLFGSFFNVVGLRVPDGKSIVKPRSACPACGHQLTAFELIPVFSYIMQKGRCRNCGKGISLLYPVMELLTALLFVYAYAVFGFGMDFLIAVTLISLFIIITVSDLAYTLIPDKILLFFFLVFLIERLFYPLEPWWNSLIGAAAAFTIFYLIAVISKGGMGGGDIKLFTLIGFALGLKIFLLAFFLSTLLGAFFGILGMLLGKMKRKSAVPFGPFIAIGTLLAFFFYDIIMKGYFSLFS